MSMCSRYDQMLPVECAKHNMIDAVTSAISKRDWGSKNVGQTSSVNGLRRS